MEDPGSSPFNDNVVFIYFGDAWDDSWRRRQQVAYRLAKLPGVKRVVYVELPLTLTSLLRLMVGKADAEASARWRRVLRRGVVSVIDGVHIVTPICPISVYRVTGVPKCSLQILKSVTRFLIVKALAEVESAKKILWLSHVFAAAHMGQLQEVMICYDCTERYSKFENWSLGLRKKADRDDAVITSVANLVFTQTSAHCGEKRKLNRSTYLVPNAVDYDLFARSSQEADSTAIAGVGRPTLGYVGSINYRTDFDLLADLARGHPEWNLTFVGPVSDEAFIQDLRDLPNAHFLGRRPYSELPRLIGAFDVCLIPYRRLALANSPIKLFDYLASGKPIVSTQIAGVEDFMDVVYVAHDGEDFARKVELALHESDPLMRQRRLLRAKENSWDARVSQIWSIIRDELRD